MQLFFLSLMTLRVIVERGSFSSRLLYVSGTFLLLLGLFHLIPAVLWPGDFSGPISFRKPIIFGISTGVTLLSLGWVVDLIAIKWKQSLSWVLAITSVTEVILISIQAWRGEASHFNSNGFGNTVIHYTIDACVLCLMVGIFWLGYLSFVQKFHQDDAMRWAVRAGMLFLSLSCLFGVFMLIYGVKRVTLNQEPGIWGEAGVLKFVHGVTIHTIQILPIQVWLMTIYSWSPTTKKRAIMVGSLGHALLLIYAALQTFQGKARFPETLLDLNIPLLVVALILITLPLIPLIKDFATPKPAH